MLVPKGPLIEVISVTVTYLEQTKRPQFPQLHPPSGKTALMKAENPPADFYRFLFNRIGEKHKWVSRRYLNNDELVPLIHDPNIEIFVLYKDGWPAGFAEIVGGFEEEVEFKFLGLLPEAQGTGLGRWFLQEVLAIIWSRGPKRVIIETCTLDHPAALRLYQKAGFTVYDQAKGLIEWHG
ncbi:MAG: GNAT family N-acetyltransferase [Pseudomonadota bacterium]